MSLAIPTIVINDDLGNTMSMTPTQLETGSGASLQTTPLTFLSNLGYALNALTQPTNTTTCNFQNAIGVQDTATMPTNSIVKMGGDPASLYGIEYTSATNANFEIKTAGTGSVKVQPPLITIDTNTETLTYTPTQFVQANSNVPTPIPASSIAKHRVILESSPVPIIDTLEPVAWTLPSGETINTFSNDSGNLYLGCESGNVYYFNTSSETWDLQATFDGAVRCIYYHALPSKLYIGGNFNNMLSPAPIGGLNKVCYIGSGLPSLANVSVDIWNNYSVNGFDKAVNAIVANNDNVYFGGKFEYTSNNSLNCRYIATYDWATTGNLYAIDNQTSGTGFDGIVWSLSLIATGNLCVAGDFNNIITNTGSATVNYCCQLQITTTFFTVAQVDFLYNNSTALSNPISKTEAVQNDGSSFYISTNDTNINGNGLNYFIGTGLGINFQAPFQLGNGGAVVQQQFQYVLSQSGNFSIGSNSVYLTNNTIIATIPFGSPYLYWNFHYARVEIYDPATGTIYAFIGSSINQFTFSGGRGLIYNGTSYLTGINFTSGQGYTAELLYGIQGSYYALISNTGNGTPQV